MERLRSADPKCWLFGAEGHRHRLAAALSQSEVRTFESAYGITLPEDYAAFLTSLGNGGAGPGYGLQRFGFVKSVVEIPTGTAKGPHRVFQKKPGVTMSRPELFDADGRKVDWYDVSWFESIKERAGDGTVGPTSLRQPFPLTKPFHRDSESQWAEIDPNSGAWMLADYGCGMCAFLVLNGAFRGQVWLHDPNAMWFVPFGETALLHYCTMEVDEADAKTTFTFCSWYEHWLDHSLADVHREYEEGE